MIRSVSLVAQEIEEMDELLPFDAVIQSEMGGKRMKFYGNTRFNFNQAYFSNWISGGESALTLLYGLDYNFNYSDRNGLVWDTNLLLSIGTTYISGSKFLKKADDRFQINSLVGKQINQFWNYSGFLNFKTQLLPGFRFYNQGDNEMRERVSQFLSPAILQGGLGFYYKKNDSFWLNLSPVSARVILVSKKYTKDLENDAKYFGVDFDKRAKYFFGALISGFYKKEIMQNIILESKYSTYINYLEKTKNVDFELDTNLRFKVNSKISGNFILHLLYDDDLLGKLQVRELLGLGINVDL
ncbi:MAG: DUF3078 domain-containing protein [Flavobacteriaceae bacterium]|jgi:hypothetical protein|nr:DUF3078 domain-containing protein [Flavobacteriaceae bacterium]